MRFESRPASYRRCDRHSSSIPRRAIRNRRRGKSWSRFGLRQRPGRDALIIRAAFLAELERRGILCIPYSHGRIRALTHHGVDASDIDRVLTATREGLRELGLAPLVA